MSFLKAFFGGSKKATAVLAGILLVVFKSALGLDDQAAQELVKLILAYVGGQSVVDLALALSAGRVRETELVTRTKEK